MAKWADYCISAVRNDSRGVIQRVRTHPDLGEKIGAYTEESRQQVIANINAGYSYVTIVTNSAGNWDKGQPVFIIKVGGVEFIKTVSNNTEQDNLDDLPTF